MSFLGRWQFNRRATASVVATRRQRIAGNAREPFLIRSASGKHAAQRQYAPSCPHALNGGSTFALTLDSSRRSSSTSTGQSG